MEGGWGAEDSGATGCESETRLVLRIEKGGGGTRATDFLSQQKSRWHANIVKTDVYDKYSTQGFRWNWKNLAIFDTVNCDLAIFLVFDVYYSFWTSTD